MYQYLADISIYPHSLLAATVFVMQEALDSIQNFAVFQKRILDKAARINPSLLPGVSFVVSVFRYEDAVAMACFQFVDGECIFFDPVAHWCVGLDLGPQPRVPYIVY